VQNEAGEMVWQPAEGGDAVSASQWSEGAGATEGADEAPASADEAPASADEAPAGEGAA
jgi:hypothetical protein